MEDLGRIDLVVMLCWLLGFMDLIAGEMGLGVWLRSGFGDWFFALEIDYGEEHKEQEQEHF